MIWALVSLTAAALQTLRNAMQSGLTARIGTIGATQVRFLFGLPFAVAFLGLGAWVTGQAVPWPSPKVLGFAAMGGVAQIGATALMLFVMKTNGFGISTAWLKGEPVIVALIGWAVLGDPLTLPMLGAIGLAVAGVLILSLRPETGARLAELQPAALGLLAGALFGLSAIGFRGAITGLESGDFLIRALTVLVLALVLQSGLLAVWMGLFSRPALLGSLAAWRPSLTAGFLGAAASACWFVAFALASAAHVRTLALTEVIFALIVARWHFGQSVTPRQLTGIAVLMAGVALLLLMG
ncbi:DMT family transporter [Neogemmobacter tilapiae]|uniref:DMT transporter permease n=1 Tax=Neogemmobacter tilapiae TaxID=875041 RepID=A0A918TUG9_9RHOB|nr:DMT family transporter [Gemmobacter tilapiae]GHC63887.1 DMT transporter permease [Gemmobacter tilapiae]